MSEERFNRLEDKVDRMDEKIDTVKLDVIELKVDIKSHIKEVQNHVAGDNKIIDALTPMLPHLTDIAEMAKNYEFQREVKRRKMETLKKWSIRLGVVGGFLGILLTLRSLL